MEKITRSLTLSPKFFIYFSFLYIWGRNFLFRLTKNYVSCFTGSLRPRAAASQSSSKLLSSFGTAANKRRPRALRGLSASQRPERHLSSQSAARFFIIHPVSSQRLSCPANQRPHSLVFSRRLQEQSAIQPVSLQAAAPDPAAGNPPFEPPLTAGDLCCAPPPRHVPPPRTARDSRRTTRLRSSQFSVNGKVFTGNT